MFTAEQDVAGNHESGGAEGINEGRLTSGAKSLSLSSKLALACPCLEESEGCPQLCLSDRTGSQVIASRGWGWLSVHGESQRPNLFAARIGAFLLWVQTLRKGKFPLQEVDL